MHYVVTGASYGIGAAATASLASRGHHVIAVARNAARLKYLGKEYKDLVHNIVADLAETHGQRAVADHVKSIGPIDGIIHSAGAHVPLNNYQDLDVESLLADMKSHVAAPIVLNNVLHESIKGGRILFIDSYSANSPRVGWAGYSIIKAAARMAARSAAAEIKEATTIRVFPGAVRTPLIQTILTANHTSPVVEMFKDLDATDNFSDAQSIGEFIANILTTATDEQLSAREFWDFNSPNDQIF